MNCWTTNQSGLVVPRRDIVRAYSRADYERFITRQRAPFQSPLIPIYKRHAAVGFDVANTRNNSGTSWTHVVAASATGLGVFTMSAFGSPVTGVSTSSDTLTKLGFINRADNFWQLAFWGKSGPTTGSTTITVTGGILRGAISFSVTGGDTTTAFGSVTSNKNESGSTSASVSVSGTTGQLTFDCCFGDNVNSITVGSGQTQIANFDTQAGSNRWMCSSYKADAVSSMAWTLSEASPWYMLAVSALAASSRPVKMAGEWGGYAGGSGGFAG